MNNGWTMRGKVWLTTLALLLAGCVPSPEKIGELTKTSMQQRFRSDPRYSGTGIEVIAVRVVGSADKTHDAIATVSHAGKKHDIPIKIVVDGINLEWHAGSTAFDFLTATTTTPATPRIPK